MRLSIFAIVFLCSVSMLFGQRVVRGSGNIVTKERSVSNDFSRIEVSGPVNVEITRGNKFSIEVKSDDNIVSYIKTDISGDLLEVRLNTRAQLRNINKMIVMVTMPALKSVEAYGAGSVTTFSSFEGDQLDIEVGGAARVNIEFEGKRLHVDAGGASQLKLEGKIHELNIDADSASSVNAKDMTARIARVEASSASSVNLTVTEEINAEASSASSIRYSGNPEKVYTDASSASSISRRSRN